ncbi:uncharacterized protein LOC133529312, partial [Cydia pomonella]|uniref:uncharacterized protein LOC133529312 n=1 Tax=Cydia pomonella TaxID=82600 RepID=UPI002ADE2638
TVRSTNPVYSFPSRIVLKPSFFVHSSAARYASHAAAVCDLPYPFGIYAHPTDLSPLTPAHFLIGRPLTCPASEDLTDVQPSRLSRYARIEALRQHFWRRWAKEYVAELQRRTKWKTKKDDISLNSLVLIKDDNLPPLNWRLGRVTRLYPGSDGVNRVADILTATGTIRRSFSKICPLLPEPADHDV